MSPLLFSTKTRRDTAVFFLEYKTEHQCMESCALRRDPRTSETVFFIHSFLFAIAAESSASLGLGHFAPERRKKNTNIAPSCPPSTNHPVTNYAEPTAKKKEQPNKTKALRRAHARTKQAIRDCETNRFASCSRADLMLLALFMPLYLPLTSAPPLISGGEKLVSLCSQLPIPRDEATFGVPNASLHPLS